jgi:hypothetical protein
MNTNQLRLTGYLEIEGKNEEIYTIEQYDSSYEFYVTSTRGIDTAANGVTFSTLQRAINYVNRSIKAN